MTGNEIREMFLKFFEERGHRRVRSSSLVPHGDPTLLFTNAGMNQFKDVFLGLEQREYKRAVSVQKCVRAGGKHNDLENVGFTNRHHTFFEMMGNFSFGDYFKKDAIAFAWELVTSSDWFAIPKDKLYFTIFEGATIPHADIPGDDEAYEHWLSKGVPKDRVFEFGMKENFWQMGDTGPCGPCSEIHYDMGSVASEQGHTDCKFPCDCGRYVEIWNLVFMQYDRKAGVKDGVPWYEFSLLPKPCVDTGMGLERVAAALLNLRDPSKYSNYDTDLFQPLIRRAEELTRARYGKHAETNASLRIIADHARTTTFLISDGVTPSNDGRGYVLRKIMRRAIFHGRRLLMEKPFLFEMVAAVRDLMGGAYPELYETANHVTRVALVEEERFSHTLKVGIEELEDRFADRGRVATARLKQAIAKFEEHRGANLGDETKERLAASLFIASSSAERRAIAEEVAGPQNAKDLFFALERALTEFNKFPGEVAFELYDTYGLPRDFIEDACRDEGFKFDAEGFDRAMEEQRKRARASWKGAHKEVASPVYAKLAETFKTEPDFYFETSTKDCRIEAIITKKGAVNELKAGESGEVVLDRTAFYAEAGGQVADVGWLYDNAEALQVAEVRGAYYPVTGLIAHRVIAKEDLRVGDRVTTVADGARREQIKRNHTATHLMHAALRNILGTHVKQSGSLVAPDHLRFDFTHFTSVDADELREIEQQVNEEILRNLELQTDVTSLDEALASGALAFFGDKYPEQNVRVVTIPDPAAELGFYSKELCGGTHVRRTGDIGVFKIVAEQSVAAGVRRVEAIAGARAFADYQRALATLRQLAAILNVGEDALPAAVERLTLATKQMEKQLEALRRKGALSQVDDLLEHVRKVKGVQVLAADVKETDREALRQLVDALRKKLGSGVVVLGSTENGKVAIIGGVTKDLTSRLHAGKIVQEVAREVGGSGGGRPDLGEAGGKDTSALKKAIGGVYQIVEQML